MKPPPPLVHMHRTEHRGCCNCNTHSSLRQNSLNVLRILWMYSNVFMHYVERFVVRKRSSFFLSLVGLSFFFHNSATMTLKWTTKAQIMFEKCVCLCECHWAMSVIAATCRLCEWVSKWMCVIRTVIQSKSNISQIGIETTATTTLNFERDQT